MSLIVPAEILQPYYFNAPQALHSRIQPSSAPIVQNLPKAQFRNYDHAIDRNYKEDSHVSFSHARPNAQNNREHIPKKVHNFQYSSLDNIKNQDFTGITRNDDGVVLLVGIFNLFAIVIYATKSLFFSNAFISPKKEQLLRWEVQKVLDDLVLRVHSSDSAKNLLSRTLKSNSEKSLEYFTQSSLNKVLGLIKNRKFQELSLLVNSAKNELLKHIQFLKHFKTLKIDSEIYQPMISILDYFKNLKSARSLDSFPLQSLLLKAKNLQNFLGYTNTVNRFSNEFYDECDLIDAQSKPKLNRKIESTAEIIWGRKGKSIGTRKNKYDALQKEYQQEKYFNLPMNHRNDYLNSRLRPKTLENLQIQNVKKWTKTSNHLESDIINSKSDLARSSSEWISLISQLAPVALDMSKVFMQAKSKPNCLRSLLCEINYTWRNRSPFQAVLTPFLSVLISWVLENSLHHSLGDSLIAIRGGWNGKNCRNMYQKCPFIEEKESNPIHNDVFGYFSSTRNRKNPKFLDNAIGFKNDYQNSNQLTFSESPPFYSNFHQIPMPQNFDPVLSAVTYKPHYYFSFTKKRTNPPKPQNDRKYQYFPVPIEAEKQNNRYKDGKKSKILENYGRREEKDNFKNVNFNNKHRENFGNEKRNDISKFLVTKPNFSVKNTKLENSLNFPERITNLQVPTPVNKVSLKHNKISNYSENLSMMSNFLTSEEINIKSAPKNGPKNEFYDDITLENPSKTQSPTIPPLLSKYKTSTSRLMHEPKIDSLLQEIDIKNDQYKYNKDRSNINDFHINNSMQNKNATKNYSEREKSNKNYLEREKSNKNHSERKESNQIHSERKELHQSYSERKDSKHNYADEEKSVIEKSNKNDSDEIERLKIYDRYDNFGAGALELSAPGYVSGMDLQDWPMEKIGEGMKKVRLISHDMEPSYSHVVLKTQKFDQGPKFIREPEYATYLTNYGTRNSQNPVLNSRKNHREEENLYDANRDWSEKIVWVKEKELSDIQNSSVKKYRFGLRRGLPAENVKGEFQALTSVRIQNEEENSSSQNKDEIFKNVNFKTVKDNFSNPKKSQNDFHKRILRYRRPNYENTKHEYVENLNKSKRNFSQNLNNAEEDRYKKILKSFKKNPLLKIGKIPIPGHKRVSGRLPIIQLPLELKI